MLFIRLRVSAGISGYVWGVCRCVGVSAGVHTVMCGCRQVWAGLGGLGWCGRMVWVGVRWCGRVCTCVWDEFSEFLLENRVPTSADFNTYPIRIFSKYFS